MAKEFWQAKKRSSKWVLNHLSSKNLKDLEYHLKQINLIAKNSGLWDFQRTGFFKQTAAFEYNLRKAIDDNVYDKAVQKSLEKSRKK